MLELYTTPDLAAAYGITTQRIRDIARHRGLGTLIGHDKRAQWVFTKDEFYLMKPGKPGKPKKG